jgi:hypothetical protein
MKVPPDSPHLPAFKEEFAKRGSYALLLVFLQHGRPTPARGLAIEKTKIHFRQASEIGPDDMDRVCFGHAGV